MNRELFAPEAPEAALEIIQDRAAARCLLHPVRLRIVEHLVSPDSASGVARRLRLPRQKVNYHLRELEKHGLVRLIREEAHGAGTERRLQARARAYALGPKLLGRLDAERALAADETAEARILRALGRAVRDMASSPASAAGAAAVEVEMVVADPEALESFEADVRRAVELLAERYRTPAGLSCRLVLALHPVASFGASLPPPAPRPPDGPSPPPAEDVG